MPFFERMVVYSRHFGLVTERNTEWTHASISAQTTPGVVTAHSEPVLRQEIINLLVKRAIERSRRAKERAGTTAGTLSLQRKMWSPSKLRPGTHQPCIIQARFQYDNAKADTCADSARRLDAYFHIQIVSSQALSEICVRKHGVSIHGDVVRAITSATYIYEMCGCGAFPLRASGISILNYLDDWLVLAHSEDVLTSHKLHYFTWKSRRLCVNKQKSVLRPSQSIMYLGVQLDSISM